MGKALQLICLVVVLVHEIHGHGMLMSPPGRSTRWRYDSSAPKNYDDNALYCGGYYVHQTVNRGRCGLCGDDYRRATPRENELGGRYGQGTIVRNIDTNVTNILVQITANHLGYIFFELCNLDTAGAESESCFQRLRFVDGSDKYYIGSTRGLISSDVVIPSGTQCNHCVLRWTYTAGNNWGICSDGRGALGCGPQETFKNCADVSINV